MTAPPGSTVDAGLPYPRLARTASWRWWRPLLGLLLAVWAGVSTLLGLGLLAEFVGRVHPAAAGLFEETPEATPAVLLATNLLIVALALPALVAYAAAHTHRLGRLLSVEGRLRRRLLGRSVIAAVFVLVLSVVSGVALEAAGVLPGDGDVRLRLPPVAVLVGFAAVLACTTPLQSAAEELVFRGWLTQALAGYGPSERAAAAVTGAVTAALFALAHLPEDFWLALDLFAFGAVASWTAWRTGGLEAAIALHVVNNIIVEALAIATGTLDEAFLQPAIPWQVALLDVTFLVAYALVVDRWAHRGERPARSRQAEHGSLEAHDVLR